jgi:plasmid stabilization system protein ParE
VPRVEVSATAIEDLDRLIRSHSLPHDTRQRVRRSLEPLKRFPLIGAELGGRWSGYRFMLGQWRWMIVVYAVIEEKDRVVITTIQDGRSSTLGS